MHTHTQLASMYKCITVNTHTHQGFYRHMLWANRPVRVNQLPLKLNVKMLKMSLKFSSCSQFFVICEIFRWPCWSCHMRAVRFSQHLIRFVAMDRQCQMLPQQSTDTYFNNQFQHRWSRNVHVWNAHILTEMWLNTWLQSLIGYWDKPCASCNMIVWK